MWHEARNVVDSLYHGLKLNSITHAATMMKLKQRSDFDDHKERSSYHYHMDEQLRPLQKCFLAKNGHCTGVPELL